MQKTMHQIFTHNDLDGAVSLLTFLWSHPNDAITFNNINNLQTDEIKSFISRTINIPPPNIYVFDLSLRESFVSDLDKEYITFIDHHKSSENFVNRFKKAKIIYSETSSNSLLIRKHFADKAPSLSNEQKKLILLTDDYDSFKLQFEESYDLNILFWAEYKNNFVKFIHDYKQGFKPFSEDQKNRIKNVKILASREAESCPKFFGSLEIKGIKKDTMGVLTNSLNNLVMDSLMRKYDPDLFFFINSKTQKVSLRQRKDKNPIDLNKFAEKFCEGAGHTYAAGGKITPLFMELTKNLKPL
jgi:oligoribonuclease NrnB/cAMP/cGMP phosphodiesterase (DHH superfamily)